MSSYDIIGDIHGHANELKALLTDIGYQRHGDGFRCSNRKVVFVGDFVDRGPAIGEVVEIARASHAGLRTDSLDFISYLLSQRSDTLGHSNNDSVSRRLPPNRPRRVV